MINILATYDDKLDRKKINNRECHIVNISVENEKPEIRPDTHNSIQDEYTWKFDKIKTDSEHLEYVLEYEQKNEKFYLSMVYPENDKVQSALNQSKRGFQRTKVLWLNLRQRSKKALPRIKSAPSGPCYVNYFNK